MEAISNREETVPDKSINQLQLEKLKGYMSMYKPYLDDTLTLQKLSQQTGIAKKEISFLLNRVMGRHFFEFINTYRIEEATNLLNNEKMNIKQVMYAVGFNSKSSFNTAFKKYMNCTPTAYRTENL